MKYDLDISANEKASRLQEATYELELCRIDYTNNGESAFQPSHVADYENWKMTNKRNKR